jgi:hypothetical protein
MSRVVVNWEKIKDLEFSLFSFSNNLCRKTILPEEYTDDDDDVYLDKLQTKGVIYPLHVKRRTANKA